MADWVACALSAPRGIQWFTHTRLCAYLLTYFYPVARSPLVTPFRYLLTYPFVIVRYTGAVPSERERRRRGQAWTALSRWQGRTIDAVGSAAGLRGVRDEGV